MSKLLHSVTLSLEADGTNSKRRNEWSENEESETRKEKEAKAKKKKKEKKCGQETTICVNYKKILFDLRGPWVSFFLFFFPPFILYFSPKSLTLTFNIFCVGHVVYVRWRRILHACFCVYVHVCQSGKINLIHWQKSCGSKQKKKNLTVLLVQKALNIIKKYADYLFVLLLF